MHRTISPKNYKSLALIIKFFILPFC